MLYNKTEKTPEDSLEYEYLKNVTFDFIEHPEDEDVWFAMRDGGKIVFSKNGEPINEEEEAEDVFPWLSEKMMSKEFLNKSVFFRENKESSPYQYEVLDVVHMEGFRYYYLTQDELKELFGVEDYVLAPKVTMTLNNALAKQVVNNKHYVGMTTARLCDRMGNPIRVRI